MLKISLDKTSLWYVIYNNFLHLHLKHEYKIKHHEELIALCPQYAYAYAAYVLKNRFELGEPAIATNTESSFWYAYGVLKNPFPLGEKAIVTDPYFTLRYAAHVVHGSFPLGEPIIASNAESSYCYAKDVLKNRFELGEPAINTVPLISKKYNEFMMNLNNSVFELDNIIISL